VDLEASSQDGRRRGGAATRERILDAAAELFYAAGIRSTSADRIIDAVGITKVTFYRHFRTKDELVVAYLEQRAAWERGAVAQAREGHYAVQALRAIASGIGEASCRPGFRGCPFINAAAEYPDTEHPVRLVVDSHRRWTHDAFLDLAAEAGVADAPAVAGQLMMLRDGAMVSGYLGDPEAVAEALAGAYLAVIQAGHRPDEGGRRG
jgi:AcrR family transcriptional regulator